jgi:hypothetical protein
VIVRVSTQHHIHTFTNELGYPDKIVLPKELYHGWNPEQAWTLIHNRLKMRALKNKMFLIKQGANPSKIADSFMTRDTCP